MSLTEVGLTWITETIVPGLTAAHLVVGSSETALSYSDTEVASTETAEAPIDNVEVVGLVQVEGQTRFRVILHGSFGEDQGNFEWRESAVVLEDGTLLDHTAEDGGRKVVGAVWDLEYVLDLIP